MARLPRPSVRFGRGDAVFVQVLLGALAVVYPATVLLPALLRWPAGDPLVWVTAVSRPGAAVPELSRPGVDVAWEDSVVWTITDPTTGQRLAALLPALLTSVLLLTGCVLAWRLVRSALAREPFGPSAVRRMRALAVLVLGYAIVLPPVRTLAGMAVLWSVDDTGSLAWLISPASLIVPLVVGLLVLMVAECFAVGQRLSADVVGLV